MVIREVNTLKLIEYIESAWKGDVNLHVFYDRSLNLKSLENMVRDTHDKIPIFFYIRKKLKDNFFCLMNECNTRAIRWLKKCGLKEIPSLSPSKDIVYLKYEKCQ